jgi:GT2 family glycosyltransferase
VKFYLLVLCVNYRNDDEVLQFVRSTLEMDRADLLRFVVADNTDREPTDREDYERKISALGPNVLSVTKHSNLGYFGGAKLGYSAGRQHFGDVGLKAVLLSNTDIEFPDTTFFDDLRREIQKIEEGSKSREIGVLAPRIESSLTGKSQNPLYWQKPSRMKFVALSLIYRCYMFAVVHRLLSKVKAMLLKSRIASREIGEPTSVYAAHGSFMIFLREYFGRGKGFDYPEFLFCEEIYVAEQCSASKLKIQYLPALRVIHREHSTTGLIPSRNIVRYLRRSHSFCKNHYF